MTVGKLVSGCIMSCAEDLGENFSSSASSFLFPSPSNDSTYQVASGLSIDVGT